MASQAGDGSLKDSDAPKTTDPIITIDLPPTVHETPADEAAIALENVPVDPVLAKPVEQVVTTTITLASDAFVVTGPETPDMLTSDRIVSHRGKAKPKPPEGGWQRLVYELTFRAYNPGDAKPVRSRKSLEQRIGRRLDGPTRYVAVLSRKGGVGKTTVSMLLGMALASIREDRVVAIDANPDRGTLAERITKTTEETVRDLVTHAHEIEAFSDFQRRVSRDETRLDVLASDTNPNLQEEFDADDYDTVADLAKRFYSIVLTDCGTGMIHSVMKATLDRADQLVVVSGGSLDEARLTSETISWLENNGYEELARNAVVALNTATQGTDLLILDELEEHFASRVRDIVRIPYDPLLATGATISFGSLKPFTQESIRELAASVVDGLPDHVHE
ncbi:MAG: MinD/ParA family protein [Microbacteriaceae bacterium]|nr:MinD/ParA family protein [Microbacteriaceae bacterium]